MSEIKDLAERDISGILERCKDKSDRCALIERVDDSDEGWIDLLTGEKGDFKALVRRGLDSSPEKAKTD